MSLITPVSNPLPRPVVAVGAAIVDGDRVLLVQRGNPPNQGLWSVPGGRLEWSESLREGVAREVREETGLEVQVGPLVEVVERVDPGTPPAYHFVILDFLARPLGGELRSGDDASEARWVGRAEWAGLPLTEGLIPVLEKALRLAATSGVWNLFDPP